jgi:hypothetical protein
MQRDACTRTSAMFCRAITVRQAIESAVAPARRYHLAAPKFVGELPWSVAV